jgi:hypothetical protein
MRLNALSSRFTRLCVSVAFLLQGVALTFLPSIGRAVPGGNLIAAISDEFDTLKPMWIAGLRGLPETLTVQNGLLSIRSVDNGDDAYPSAEDMLCMYADQLGRPLNASERPSIVAQVWLPPFDQWPTGVNDSGYREWFGLRAIAYDAALPDNNGLYWPGIYVATDDAGPCLIARVGDGYTDDITFGRISAPGWWTLGIAWNKEGRLECYAAQGRVALTKNDLLHTTPTNPTALENRSLTQLMGTFLALRMTSPPTGQLSTDWRMDFVRTFVKQYAWRDLDGDGNTDLVFQNDAGQLAAWHMDGAGTAISLASISDGALGDWKVAGVADLNGDDIPDLVFQNTTGAIYVWYLDASGAPSSGAFLFTGALGDWRIAGVADMNGDGTPDFVFQNTTGAIYAWYLDGGGAVLSGAFLFTGALGDWRIAGIADMNNDGKADLVFQNTTGAIYVWYLDGSGAVSSGAFVFTGALGEWRIVGVADMNNDGRADIVFQNTIGQIYAWYLDGNGATSSGAFLFSGNLGDWHVR